jgi:outer membrane protein assembly factor BamB
MKQPLLRAILFLSLFCCPCILIAGTGQPLWTKESKSSVSWQKVTPLGLLIASTSRGLASINTQTGEELWIIESLKNAPEAGYEVISGSPFVSMTTEDGKNFCIVDPVAGKIIFNTKEAGLEQITDKYFLYASAKILVIGTSQGGKKTDMVMADMTNGKKLWNKTGAFTFTTAVKDLGNDEVLLTSAFFAMKLKASTGDEIWKMPIDPRTGNITSLMSALEGFLATKLTKEELMAQLITTEYKPDIFIMAAQSKNESTKTDSKGQKTVTISYNAVFMAFDLQSGKHKWAAVVEMPYPLGISYPCTEGLIISAANSGSINMLNYNDGTKMLGKKGGGLNLKGPAAGAAPMSDGKLLMVSSSGSNSSLAGLDPKSGTLVFDKAAKIKGAVSYTEMLPTGILVGSDAEVNLLNTTTGEWYLEDAITGGASLIASNDKMVYVFNTKDGLLYQMEATGTGFKALNTVPVKFQGKEVANGIEITPQGVIVKSEQNLALVETSGTVKFNNYFPAPGVSGLRKALLIASAVRAAYYTAAFTTYSAAFGASSQSIQVKDASSKAAKDVTGDISRIFGEAAVTGAGYTSMYIKMAQQRFKATTETPEYNLIMTSPDKSTVQLIQVSKTTGEVMSTIQLGKDKNPKYDVDMVDGKLYYMKDAVTMEGYKF